MTRSPSSERLAEFQTYLGFFRSMWAFQEILSPGLGHVSALPDGTSCGEFAAARAEQALAQRSVPFSALLTGMKQGVADQLEMTRGLPAAEVKRADAFLTAAGAVSLTEMRRRVWRVIPKVLKRGRIRTLDEFYVVKNVLDDDGENLSKNDRMRLERMRFEFEAAPSGPSGSDRAGRRGARTKWTPRRG